MIDVKTLIAHIEKEGLKARGKKELIAHLKGEKISRSGGMRAACYQCMGYFVDGRQDCGIETCPMFAWRPFKEKGNKAEEEPETEETEEDEKDE